MDKPLLDEVLKFAEDKIRLHIYKKARNLPKEQQEEASQDALLRVLEAYERLDPKEPWKSFIDLHCRGGVIDYIKLGKGHMEDRKGKDSRNNITSRLSNLDLDMAKVDVETIAALNGVFSEVSWMDSQDIKWELVSKMASVDSAIHLLAKLILGFSMDELSEFFKCSKETLSRRYRRFLKRLNMPSYARDPWMDQFIFAFGLSEMFHLKEVDNGLGHDYQSVDLYSNNPLKSVSENDGPAYSWISELFPEDCSLKEFESEIKWKLLARMAAIDEEICLIALIIKGFSRLKLSEIFDDTPESLKSRCLRFVRKLDSSQFYNDEWTQQTIYALGLSSDFKQEEKDFELGHYVMPLDFSSFQNYKQAIRGKEQLNLLAVI
jgi:DNA-directed RNA polymerase specialized sigma24 family protein